MADDNDEYTFADDADQPVAIDDASDDATDEDLDDEDDFDWDDDDDEAPADLESRLDAALDAGDADDEGDQAEAEATVGEQFSAFALRKLPAKMRSRPLSAQANDWIISTIGRLVESQPVEGSPLRAEIAALIDAAEVREIVSMLSDHTLEEAYRLARSVPVDAGDSAAPVEETESEAPIGKAGNLAGEPNVLAIVVELPIADVAPDPDQPRDEGADAEIGDDIHPDTILPPIEVRPHPQAGEPITIGLNHGFHPPYIIVDGERRYRGSLKAGRETIRAIVNERPMDAGDLLLRQSALNQGKRLKPLEEARTWKRIIESKGWTASQLADYLKKPRSTVADRLAILDAPAAFQPLFISGVFSAAAAPVVRQFANVPSKILERAIEEGSKEYEWRDAVEDGKPVPVKDLKFILETIILDEELREIPPELRARYTGEVVRVGKVDYALNVDALEKLAAEYAKENAGVKAKSASAKPAKQPPTQYQLEERKRQAAAKRKAELRRAQFAAISDKLPISIGGAWLLPIIQWLLREVTNDTLRAAVKALDIEPPEKSVHGSYDFGKAIAKHAEGLGPGLQSKLIMQLLLASDLVVSSWSNDGASRFAAAAKLLKIDLGKVKVPDPSEFPANAKAAKESAAVKKSASSKK